MPTLAFPVMFSPEQVKKLEAIEQLKALAENPSRLAQPGELPLVQRTVRTAPPEQLVTYLAGMDIIPAPIIDALSTLVSAEVARRRAAAEAIALLRQLAASTLPEGVEYYPGYEPGGVADVLLGLITGQGIEGARRVMPVESPLRRVQRVQLPQQLMDVLTSAMDINQILETARQVAADVLSKGLQLPRYGAATVGGGGPVVTEVYEMPQQALTPVDMLSLIKGASTAELWDLFSEGER